MLDLLFSALLGAALTAAPFALAFVVAPLAYRLACDLWQYRADLHQWRLRGGR